MGKEVKTESLQERKKQERLEKEALLKEQCEKIAAEKYGDQLKKWSNAHKGLWYLPLQDEEGVIVKLGILKPITRSVLSYASEKIQTEGLYEFLECVMRESWVGGDEEILDDDTYFIPASQKVNKMLEGFNASLVKR